MTTKKTTRLGRDRLEYWLELDGMDPATARSIARRQPADALAWHPDLRAEIERACEGLFAYLNDC